VAASIREAGGEPSAEFFDVIAASSQRGDPTADHPWPAGGLRTGAFRAPEIKAGAGELVAGHVVLGHDVPVARRLTARAVKVRVPGLGVREAIGGEAMQPPVFGLSVTGNFDFLGDKKKQ
jgi:hypothetical protein